MRRCMVSRLVAVFAWFLLKDQFQSITDSIKWFGSQCCRFRNM